MTEEKKLMDMVDHGISYIQIAKEIGVDKQRLSYLLNHSTTSKREENKSTKELRRLINKVYKKKSFFIAKNNITKTSFTGNESDYTLKEKGFSFWERTKLQL